MLSTDIKIKIYRTRRLLIVSCGFETWYVTGGENRLGLFVNWILMRLLRGKIVTGGRRKLRKDELCGL